ncbi:MAG: AlpA family phage regulatory protein [Methylibium sp.]|uniref:helix-turn-helix transcriptional regulator n=1 Tax=Methylibium sp. TaxID=2067992 RepID=UPI0017CB393D|nr:AlpA family phage regulatory protein [Methylibium sp.]MBA3597951.1 AlpA family phage regulatory protein [Methylibium sp.]
MNPSTSIKPRNPRALQSLDVLAVEDALLKIGTVAAVTGSSPTSLYRWLEAGRFPQPIRLSSRCTRWRAGDVTAWLQAQAGRTS